MSNPRIRRAGLVLLASLVLAGLLGAPLFSASAQPILTLTNDPTLTWNVVGLDSNDVNVGPNNFPGGVRVCNTGDATATNLVATFVWDTGDGFINLRTGSLNPITLGSLAAGTCHDFYFEITITRDANAYDHTRRFHIEVDSDQTGVVTTTTPREVYVERLISQSRNSTTDVLLDGVSIPAGGTMALVVGNTYTIELVGATATNGYEQIETFINFPNTIFRVNSVATTYTANGGTDPQAASKLYADGCGWVNDPNSPAYRSCSGTGKYGGNITVTYDVTIIGGGGTSQTLNTLIYDFSGSSYHYNADFSTSARFAAIVDPASLTLAKVFAPDPTNVNGVSVLTFTITNPNGAAVSGLNFTDTFPTSPGAMVVASPSNASTSGCGSPTFAPNPGDPGIAFANGTVAANGACTIRVNVTPPATGAYLNTSNNLFVGTTDTGDNATDTLTVNSSPPPPACVPGIALAQWTFPAGFNVNAPVPSSGSGTASPGAGVVPTSFTDGTDSWGSNGGIATGATLVTTNNDYFEFAITPTGISSVDLTFAARRGNSANSPTGVAVYYGTASGNPETGTLLYSNATVLTTTLTGIGGTHTFAPSASTMYVRIYFYNSGNTNPGADGMMDNVTFTGCGTPNPPTLAKAFSPDPVAVGASSTLTFTVTNPNALVSLSGIAFNDTLPSGVTVASGSSSVCGGTLTTTAPDSISFSGGTLAGGASCPIAVTVTATTAGPHDNVSGFVSSTQSGTNTGPTGVASASLTAIMPPVIAKNFSPDPILAGGTSTLTFTLTNPNPNNALSGVAFSDTFPLAPGAMVVASPTGASTSGCGAPTYAPVAGAGSITFSGGTIGAGGSCTVKVNVTAPTTGSYGNTSGNVSHVINAATVNGNTASDTLTVTSPSPAIGLLKQVGPTASGPWTSFLAVAPAGNVHYRFTVENSGDVPLSLTAPIATDIVPAVNTLAAGCVWRDYLGAVVTLPATLPVAGATDAHIITCVVGPLTAVVGSNPNTATATGTYSGTPYTDSSSATYATTGLTLVKTAAQTTFLAAGNVLNYSYLVTNSGFAPLAGPVTISDDKSTNESCPAIETVGDFDAFLDPGESITCTATYTVLGADVSAGSVTNNAFATAAGVNSNSDSETVTYLAPPTVAKIFFPSTINVGGTSTLIITLNNPGGTTLTSISFTDTYPAAIVNAATPNASTTCSGGSAIATAGGGSISLSGASLAAGAACSVTVDVTSAVAGSHLNTILVGGVTTSQGVSNTTGASAALTVNAPTNTPTPTPTNTPTPTDTASPTPTDTASPTPTDTASPTPTDTASPTPTDTASPTPTDTASPTPTDTASPTPTDTASPTPTDTASPTPTDTASPTPTDTASPTPTDTASPTPTDTASPTPTDTASPTPTDTASPTPTDTASPTPTDTASPTPTDTASPTPTNTASPTPTDTASPTPTDTASPTPTDTASPTPTDTASPTPTDTASPTPTDTASPTPTDTASPTPTDTASPTPTDTASPTPTDTASPTPTDTASPTPTDTASPTPTDTASPTPTNTVTSTATSTNTATPTATTTSTATGVAQVVDPAVTKSGNPATASIGDTIVFTLVITNNGTVDAINVQVVDPIPSFLTITNVVSAPAATADNSSGNTVDLLYAVVTPSDVYTVTITTVVNSSATPPGGSNIVTLTADADDDPTNNTDSATITIVVGGLGAPETGFAPGRLTNLPPQAADAAYTEYGELWLEIPKLALQTSIAGVPQSGGSWDVSWLGEQAGYLNGTAFPTWSGNSVITAHVTLPSGDEGPFADLKSLRFGDRVIVHGWGLRHIYEIRQIDLVSPADRQIFRHEERSWLTLVTCHGYDEREASYRWRVAARAVLVQIEGVGSLGVSAESQVAPASGGSRPAGSTSGR